MTDVLAEIIQAKRAHVAARMQRHDLDALRSRLPKEPPRGFASALAGARAAGLHPLIAEIKKASPSKGLIRTDFNPAALADAYRSGGATCLSVLTDIPYFQGSDVFLAAARQKSGLPVLRKDFMIVPWQIFESRWLGADCVLVIMACLTDVEADELVSTALNLGLDVLVEVHDEAELERALRLPRECLLGINNRNLKTLAVDLATFERLSPMVSPERLLVAESGLYELGDLLRMRAAGAGAYLVGESLMREADVERATRRLLGLA